MIMSLKNHINIIFINNRCQLCTKNHTVRIRMISRRSVDILMESYHTPFCIRIICNGFSNHILMGSTIIVIGIQNNKQYIAIGIVIIRTGSCFILCISIKLTFLIIWIIKMITVIWIFRIMVTNGGCYWQRTKSRCS